MLYYISFLISEQEEQISTNELYKASVYFFCSKDLQLMMWWHIQNFMRIKIPPMQNEVRINESHISKSLVVNLTFSSSEPEYNPIQDTKSKFCFGQVFFF